MSNKVEHLKLIQSVINRMAKNSFAMKGWAVTVVTGLFALAVKDSNNLFVLIAYIPIFVFWLLDSYYLMLERLYRNLYDDIRQRKEDDIDFSMRTNAYKHNSKSCYLKCLISISEVIYIPLAFSPIVMMFIVNK